MSLMKLWNAVLQKYHIHVVQILYRAIHVGYTIACPGNTYTSVWEFTSAISQAAVSHSEVMNQTVNVVSTYSAESLADI